MANNYILTSDGNFILEDELYHYGIKGMKWGVRRYEKYSGSYMKAGLKRYNSAMNTYDKKLLDYEKSKKAGLKGDSLKLKKAKVKEAKRDVKKHYKHLKLDKKADQGKILYASGKRIKHNALISKALVTAGSMSLGTAAYIYKTGMVKDSRVTKALAAIGGGLIVSGGIKLVTDDVPNNKLRAYYSHTSNY